MPTEEAAVPLPSPGLAEAVGGRAWATSPRDGRSIAGSVDKLGVVVGPGVGQMEAPRPQKSVSERKELPQSLHQPGPPLEGPQALGHRPAVLPGLQPGPAFPRAGWLTRPAGCECSASKLMCSNPIKHAPASKLSFFKTRLPSRHPPFPACLAPFQLAKPSPRGWQGSHPRLCKDLGCDSATCSCSPVTTHVKEFLILKPVTNFLPPPVPPPAPKHISLIDSHSPSGQVHPHLVLYMFTGWYISCSTPPPCLTRASRSPPKVPV